MSKSVLQKFVVDVLTIGSEYRTPTDQAPQNGERSLRIGQSEGNYRNRQRQRWWELSALPRGLVR